jgi:hypothetical protein
LRLYNIFPEIKHLIFWSLNWKQDTAIFTKSIQTGEQACCLPAIKSAIPCHLVVLKAVAEPRNYLEAHQKHSHANDCNASTAAPKLLFCHKHGVESNYQRCEWVSVGFWRFNLPCLPFIHNSSTLLQMQWELYRITVKKVYRKTEIE